MGIEERVKSGKIVRYRGRNYEVKVWYSCRDKIYFVAYRWGNKGNRAVEYYEYTNINDAIAEFSSGAGL